MSALDFQKKHRKALEDFLSTEVGRDLMQVLHDLRPPASFGNNEPSAAYVLGVISGYERCEQAIIALSLIPKTAIPQPEADYGVKEKPKGQNPEA